MERIHSKYCKHEIELNSILFYFIAFFVILLIYVFDADGGVSKDTLLHSEKFKHYRQNPRGDATVVCLKEGVDGAGNKIANVTFQTAAETKADIEAKDEEKAELIAARDDMYTQRAEQRRREGKDAEEVIAYVKEHGPEIGLVKEVIDKVLRLSQTDDALLVWACMIEDLIAKVQRFLEGNDVRNERKIKKGKKLLRTLRAQDKLGIDLKCLAAKLMKDQIM